MARLLIITTAVALFAYLQIAEGLKCYHCGSAVGGDCDNNGTYRNNPENIKECDPKFGADQVCYIKQETLTTVAEIVRGCTPRANCTEVRAPVRTCTFCESDLCNSGISALPSLFFISVSAAFVKMYI